MDNPSRPPSRMTPELAELWRLRFQLQEAAAMIKLSPQSAYTPEMMTVMEKMRDTWDGLSEALKSKPCNRLERSWRRSAWLATQLLMPGRAMTMKMTLGHRARR